MITLIIVAKLFLEVKSVPNKHMWKTELYVEQRHVELKYVWKCRDKSVSSIFPKNVSPKSNIKSIILLEKKPIYLYLVVIISLAMEFLFSYI